MVNVRTKPVIRCSQNDLPFTDIIVIKCVEKGAHDIEWDFNLPPATS